MPTASATDRPSDLVALARDLGREDRRLAILGEGNVSTRVPGADAPTFLVKSSGKSLATLAREDLVACRSSTLLELLDTPDAGDAAVERALMDSRVDPGAPRPSVEAVFHAYLLGLPGVEWVGHAHPVSVNRILCSPRAEEFAERRIFPDEVVCCGEASVFVPFTDPGLRLAAAIRRPTDAYLASRATPPRVILLGSHGVITLGATPQAVLAAMLMTVKSAEIWFGAATLGGPVFLPPADVRRLAGRSDEHYRQRVLKLS